MTDPMGLGVDWQVPPSNLVALNLQTAMKQLQRQLADLTERAQSTSEMEHSFLGRARLQEGFEKLTQGLKQLLDPTYIRMIRSTSNRYGTMLGEMWHTDGQGRLEGGVDTFLANTGTNTPAKDPSKGFYSTNGPLPPGNYEIKGREASQVAPGAQFGVGWPAITSPGLPPGKIYAPGGQIRSALLIHGYGISNGCLCFPGYALQNVFRAMAAGPVYLNVREEAVPPY